MSLREHLRRRARRAWLIQLTAFAAVVLGLTMVPPGNREGLVFGAAMLFLIAFAFAQARIACTRCGNALGTVIPPWRLHRGDPAKRIHHCPFCGVSLDEPADAPRT